MGKVLETLEHYSESTNSSESIQRRVQVGGGGTLSSDTGYIRRVGTAPRAVKAVRSVRAEKVSRVVRKQKQREQ